MIHLAKETYLVTPEWLLDGTGSSAKERGAVLVQEGRISRVYSEPPPASDLPPSCQVLDLPGATLLPGLIDAHVHLCLPGNGTLLPQAVAEPRGVIQSIALRNANVALRSGITTLRDCGGFPDVLSSLRRAIDLGYGDGPRLVLAGWPLTTTGGHCYYFGGEADGPQGVREKVRAATKLGADYVKVMGSGGGTPGTIIWRASFDQEEVAALIDEAHRLTRKVIIHCLCAEAIEQAVVAGADEVEHGYFFVDPDTTRFDSNIAEAVAKARIPVCPTLSVSRFVIAAGDPDAERRKHIQSQILANASSLRSKGVPFVAGSDAGWLWSPFNALYAELELMTQIGLSPAECIVAATSGAATQIGLGKVTGTIRSGLMADLLAVRGRPDVDIRVLAHVAMVMKEGYRIV